MIPLLLLALAVVFLVIGLVMSQVKARSFSELSWNDLVAKLQPVRSEGIRAMALEYLNPSKGQIGTEPNDLWEMIGGEEGLDAMRANAEILIALAARAAEWNHAESVIVGERMRRDGLALRKAVVEIKRALDYGSGRERGAFYLHEAASAYHLMRQRLLALYETSHAGRYPMLVDAV